MDDMTNKHLAIVLGALLLIVGASYISNYFTDPARALPEAKTIGLGDITFDELSTRFRDLAKDKGGRYAFDVLRHSVLRPGTDMHLIGHEIGNELYNQEGIDGMSICTHEFRNACSHSIVIGYMQENGDGADVRKAIDDACRKAPGGSGAYAMCYHGLGHGVFAYYGYTYPKTIDFCTKAGTKEENFVQREECIGGSLMELVGGGGHDREKWLESQTRYFKKNDALAPCNTDAIPKSAKPMCYVYLTPHFMEFAGTSFQNFTDESMAKAMDVCDVLPRDTPERLSCTGGFGKDIAAGVVGQNDSRLLDKGTYTDAQLKEVERLCMLESDQQDIQTCEVYALSTFFWGGEAEKNLAFRFCGILSNEASKDYCFTDLSKRIAYTLRDPAKRTERCSLLDEKYRSACSAK